MEFCGQYQDLTIYYSIHDVLEGCINLRSKDVRKTLARILEVKNLGTKRITNLGTQQDHDMTSARGIFFK